MVVVGVGEVKRKGLVGRLAEMRILTPKEVTLRVVDSETGEPVEDAMVVGLKLLIPFPVTPRRTNEKGEVKIYTLTRFLAISIFKQGYRATLWFQALTDEREQSYEVTLEKRPS